MSERERKLNEIDERIRTLRILKIQIRRIAKEVENELGYLRADYLFDAADNIELAIKDCTLHYYDILHPQDTGEAKEAKKK